MMLFNKWHANCFVLKCWIHSANTLTTFKELIMKKILFIISLVLLSISAQSQEAAQPQESGSSNNLWKLLDTNTDGSISKAEASASRGVFENWDNLDVNQDDKLDIAEFSKLFSQ
jgi:hypothetical protein